MKCLKQCGWIAIFGMILAVWTGCMSVNAAETGTIAGMSEKVYENKDADSNIVANVIRGCTFSILAEEKDEEGAVWYFVETDMKIRGYIQAQNVVKAGQNAEGNGNAGENGNEDNLSDNADKQILTVETVNIRQEPSTDEDILGKISRGTELDYIAEYTDEEGDIWYEVNYEDLHGYVKGSAVVVMTPSSVQEPGSGENAVNDENNENDINNENSENNENNEADVPDINTDIGQTPEPYPDGDPQEEIAKGQTVQEEEQVQPSPEITDTPPTREEARQEKTKERAAGFRIDMVVVAAFLGILLCVALIGVLLKRMIKIYR